MASSYLTRTPSSASNRKTWTFSAWVKRSAIPDAAGNYLFQQSQAEGNYMKLYFYANKIYWRGQTGESNTAYKVTNRLFRDTSAWYHVVARFDSTQSTAGDRMRLYINGVEETSFSTDTNPDLNHDSFCNTTNPMDIGRDNVNNGSYFDGYMSHVSFVDGQSLAPTVFGETDSTSGIWKFKSPSGVTWGTNGFHLKMENSGAMGTDSSGNTNTFTVNGNLKQSLSTPSNIYVTINPLDYWYRNPVLSIGNTKIVDTTGWSGARGDFGFSTGKWYWEIKLTGSMDNHIHGVQLADINNTRTQDPQQITGTTVFYNHDGGEMRTDGTQTTADYGTFSSGDIMGVAVDMTAGSYGQITIYKNGSAIVSNFNLSSSSTTVMPFSAVGNCTTEYNFGNGFFGTTAITSAGSNGNGSLFEYDVPSGHYALNTKNLNTYG